MITHGLEDLRHEHLSKNVLDAVDVSNAEHRVTYSLLGLIGTHPSFDAVRSYVSSRLAYQRLKTLDDFHLRLGVVAGEVADQDKELFWKAQLVPWHAGRALGILDVLGEISGSAGTTQGVPRHRPRTESFERVSRVGEQAARADGDATEGYWPCL